MNNVDWNNVTEEASKLLSEYIKFDTTNPPGNEKVAAEFIADILRREGYSPEILSYNNKRANLVCRFKGETKNKEQALLLLSHIDVVGATAENWQFEPFSGTIKDGYIWGRGALDCKGPGIMELMAFILLKRTGAITKRDIILLAVADEEAGGEAGAGWVVKNHWDKVSAGYVLNEGGMGIKGISGKDMMLPCFGEKGPLWLKLTAKGEAGHGSVPIEENPNNKLVFALEHIIKHETRINLLPEIKEILIEAGKDMKLPVSFLIPFITNDLVLNLFKKRLKAFKKLNAILRNTISVTNIKSGFKENVIPSTAEAILDCRLLPGQDKETFIEELRNVIDNPDIDLEIIQFQAPSYSSPKDKFMQAIKKVITRNHPGIPFYPVISSGFTDSRFFREKGAIAYGFIPCLLSEKEIDSMHGVDERISLKCLGDGIKNIFDLCKDF